MKFACLLNWCHVSLLTFLEWFTTLLQLRLYVYYKKKDPNHEHVGFEHDSIRWTNK